MVVVSFVFIITTFLLQQKSFASISLGTCSLQCSNESSVTLNLPNTSLQGRPGKRGPRGFKGEPGNGCDCPSRPTSK